jgi:hypothetical protein
MLTAVMETLARDVSPWGGFTSPLLSWLGSVGLVAFFAWQLVKLFRETRRVEAPFLEVAPLLAAHAERVEARDLHDAYDRAVSERKTKSDDDGLETTVEVDRLTDLDTEMRQVEAFRRPWVQFRKTMLIEHVAWFKEPRVFTTRRAEEFFTEEAVLDDRIDLGFYAQVPTLITGFGLLLTFVAICIGLSRLHADGQTVDGIQGLINGLAGKFLTSIVGLVCANLFLLLERPAVRRLRAAHADFLAALDESFPRRTIEDLIDALSLHRPARESTSWDGRGDDASHGGRGSWDRVGDQIDELTSAVRALSERVHEPRESVRMLSVALDKLEASQARSQGQVTAQMGALIDRLAALASARQAPSRDLKIGANGDAAPRDDWTRGRGGPRHLG